MNVIEAIQKIEKHAETVNNQDIRVVKEHKIGNPIRQGDIYIHPVSSDFKVGDEIKIRQVADGVSMGARHILHGNVKVYNCDTLPDYMHSDFRGFVSYAFDVYGEGAVLTHPEHAHIEMPCSGRYVVTYQMDARTRKRVQD